MSELKPLKCSCGGKPIVWKDKDKEVLMVLCKKCGLSVSHWKTAVEKWNRIRRYDALRARIGELEAALIKAKVAMDWLGDRMNDMDVVEEQDTAITDPLFAEVDKVLKVIDPDGSRVKQEEQIAEARGEEALKGAGK